MEKYKYRDIEVEVQSLELQDCIMAVLEALKPKTEREADRIQYDIYADFGIKVRLYPSRSEKIQELKEELSRSDYIALKAFEGADMAEYPDWKQKRQGLRDEINRIDAMTDDEWDAENEGKMNNGV